MANPPRPASATPQPVLLRPWEWGVLAAVVGVSLAIVGASAYLPMNDASSHLGTAVIAIRLLEGDTFFSAHYRFLPEALPYWATTLATVPLIPLLGPLKSLVAVMSAYVVLLPLSFYVLMRTAAPDNLRLTAVAALAAFNWAYWLGETNFLLGQPAALFALALFLRIPISSRWALGGFLALAATAYTCHIYALTAVLVAVSALATLSLASHLWAALRPYRFVRAQWLGAAFVLALFAAGAYLILYRPSSTAILAHDRKDYGIVFSVGLRRLAHVVTDPFKSPTLPEWPALGFMTVVGGVLALSAWTWSVRTPARATGAAGASGPGRSIAEIVNLRLLMPAAALIGAFYLGPARTVREGEIGQRFLLLGFLLLLGAIRLRPGRAGAALLAAAVVVFGGFKLADAWRLHRDYDATMATLSGQLLSRIPERSRVVPIRDLQAATDVQQLYHRLANYVVVERHGYSANILATPGQQALQHVRAHKPGPRQRAGQRSPSEKGLSASDWDYFDYVLIQSDRAQPEVPLLEERTTFMARTGDFSLYRINHPATAVSSAAP